MSAPSSDIDGPRIVETFPHKVRQIEHQWIEMPDQVRLSARIWLPEGAETTPVPAILEYIPYRKRDSTRPSDDRRHGYWAGHGFACIRLDIRGTGESEGLITDEYPKSEQDDAVAAIAWIAAQPWCNGNVGMTGISWGGFNGLQVAARRPPALKAVITHCSTDDRYADDVHWMGGCLLLDGFFWGSGFYQRMARPPDKALDPQGWRARWLERLENWEPPASHIWMRHQRRDDYWRQGSVCENYADIECAVYAVGGWEDGYSNAVPRLLANLSCPAKGLVGPWGHKYPEVGMPGPAVGFLQQALRWWDHWLKGEDSGIMDEPAYTVWMQDFVVPDACLAEVPGRWVAERAWPSVNVSTRSYVINNNGLGGESEAEVVLRHNSPQTLGVTGGNWCPYGLGGSSPDLAIDQREDDGQSLSFDTQPLDAPIEILGAPVARMRLAVDQPQGILAVRLMDVAPDGTSRRISFGLLNLTHREDQEHIRPMVPGEMTEVVVQLNDLAHRVVPGHRLRLALSTAYWPMAWPGPAPVELALETGSSRLDLPLRNPETGPEAPKFEPPEMAGTAISVIEPERSARAVERDIATGRWVTRLVEESGRYHIEDIGLDVVDGMTADFTIDEDDPLSAEAIWHWHSLRHREDWHMEVDSTTRVRATAADWLIDTDVEARDGDEVIFTRNWREKVPRDGV